MKRSTFIGGGIAASVALAFGMSRVAESMYDSEAEQRASIVACARNLPVQAKTATEYPEGCEGFEYYIPQETTTKSKTVGQSVVSRDVQVIFDVPAVASFEQQATDNVLTDDQIEFRGKLLGGLTFAAGSIIFTLGGIGLKSKETEPEFARD